MCTRILNGSYYKLADTAQHTHSFVVRYRHVLSYEARGHPHGIR
jgi:hypothetical protein